MSASGEILMAPPVLPPAAERALAAYGGEGRWRGATAVEAVVSTGGIAFASKLRPSLLRLSVRADVARPRVVLGPIDRRRAKAILDGHDLWLETPGRGVHAVRREARRELARSRRLLWWDALDHFFFVAYALWNYLCFPALLLRSDIAWTDEGASCVEARFPAHLPTHCAVQRFHFDPATNLLLRHDYTAEVFGGWARAVHRVLEHGRSGEVPFAARRRVVPRTRDNRPWSGPTLVWVEVHEWRLV